MAETLHWCVCVYMGICVYRSMSMCAYMYIDCGIFLLYVYARSVCSFFQLPRWFRLSMQTRPSPYPAKLHIKKQKSALIKLSSKVAGTTCRCTLVCRFPAHRTPWNPETILQIRTNYTRRNCYTHDWDVAKHGTEPQTNSCIARASQNKKSTSIVCGPMTIVDFFPTLPQRRRAAFAILR